MKTTIRSLFAILTVFSILISFASCRQDEEVLITAPNTGTPMFKTIADMPEYCGTPLQVDLLAGQTILAGNVLVANDANNLYVTYTTTDGWLMKEIHLYVGSSAGLPVNKAGNPTIGLFPYNMTFNPYVATYTFVLPLADFPDLMTIAAHAALVKLDGSGNVVDSQTGWGNGVHFAKSWAMKFEYTKQECVNEPPVPECYQSETAWAAGTRYVMQGNWAMYTTYAPGVVQIFAGQTIPVGTVTLSAINPDNTVTISISLVNGWMLNPSTTEPVKIQGYSVAPTANPSPGLFTTYKGTSLIVTVPYYIYYGIHLDVILPTDCE